MVTEILITQNNIESGSNLIAAHTDTFILAEAVYTTDAPSFLDVEIYDEGDILIDTARAYFSREITVDKREYSFYVNPFVKSVMPDYSDFEQVNDSFVYCENMTKVLKFVFVEPTELLVKSDVFALNFLHANVQFGESVSLIDFYYSSFGNTYFCEKNKSVYVYFYNNIENQYISITKNGNILINNALCPKIGFYRLKTIATENTEIEVFYGAGEIVYRIKIQEECSGLILKYLDKVGMYRFLSLNNFYETKANPTQIGSVENSYTNVLTAQSNVRNVGYTNQNTISGTTEVDIEMLPFVADLYVSPKVYLKIGTGDITKDWLEVTVKASENIVRRRKASSGFIDFTITLPKSFTTKLI